MGYYLSNPDQVFEVAKSELFFEAARSGGSGGQNVNKVSSKAILRWNVAGSRLHPSIKDRLLEKLSNKLTQWGELIVTSERNRDQPANKRDCLEKLEAILKEALYVERTRIATKPTRSSQRKRVETKRRQQSKKQMRGRVNWDD